MTHRKEPCEICEDNFKRTPEGKWCESCERDFKKSNESIS